MKLDYDVADALQGLVFVDIDSRQNTTSNGILVKFVEHYSGHNISAAVKPMLNTTNVKTVFGITDSGTVLSILYDSDTDSVNLLTSISYSAVTGLADANTLYNNGVFGIEEW